MTRVSRWRRPRGMCRSAAPPDGARRRPRRCASERGDAERDTQGERNRAGRGTRTRRGPRHRRRSRRCDGYACSARARRSVREQQRPAFESRQGAPHSEYHGRRVLSEPRRRCSQAASNHRENSTVPVIDAPAKAQARDERVGEGGRATRSAATRNGETRHHGDASRRTHLRRSAASCPAGRGRDT